MKKKNVTCFNLKRQIKIGVKGMAQTQKYKNDFLQEHALDKSMHIIDVLYKHIDDIYIKSLENCKSVINEKTSVENEIKDYVITEVYNSCITEFYVTFNNIIQKSIDIYIQQNNYSFLNDEEKKFLQSMLRVRTRSNLDILIQLIKELLDKDLKDYFKYTEEINIIDNIYNVESLDIEISGENDEDENIGQKKIRLNYISKFIELSNFAREYGFKFLRQKGDHVHFKNSDGMLVTIPKRNNIGKGLSFIIQKQIINPGVFE